MAGDEKQTSASGGANPFMNKVRHYAENGWTADKYARMAIYTFLYNKIQGMPRDFGLDNNTVSWMAHDYIKKHMPELVKKFELDKIPYMNFNENDVTDPNTGEVIPGGLKTFVSEIDSYIEHASEICGAQNKMPTDPEMNQLLEALKDNRSKPFESIRKSVKHLPGAAYDKKSGANEEGWLWDERLKVHREIQENNRLARRTGFWAAAKGLGVVGCAGGVVVSAMVIFAPATLGLVAGASIGNLIAGGIGAFVSGVGVKNLIGSLSYSLTKLFGHFRKGRDLKNKAGYKGKRGLKAIERDIAINEALKGAYGEYGKLTKPIKDANGKIIGYKFPTYEEFEAHVLKNYPMLRKATEEEVKIKNLYYRAREWWNCREGAARKALDFVSSHKTFVIRNNEIPLEKEERYNNMFGAANNANSADGIPSLNNSSPSLVLSKMPKSITDPSKVATINEYVQTLINLNADEKRYMENHEEDKYRIYQGNAGAMLPLMFQREIFDKAFTGSTYRDCNNLIEGNEIVKKYMKEHNNTGDKTPYVKNALAFVQFEMNDETTRLDPNIGVSIKQQLSLDGDNMIKACVELGVDESSAEYADIVTIANQIQNMEFKNENYANEIINKVSNERARNYLLHMLEKRNSNSKASLGEIQGKLNEEVYGSPIATNYPDYYNNICKLIVNLQYDPNTKTYYSSDGSSRFTLDDIKNIIYNKDQSVVFSDEDRTFLSNFQVKAYNLLLDQMTSLERRKIDDIRANSVDNVRNNQVNYNLEEIYNTIDGLDFDKISAPETMNFYRTRIEKIQPIEIQQYVKERLKIKVEKLFEERIITRKDYTGKEGLKAITEDLIILERTKLLDEANRQRIMNKYSDRITQAFEVELHHLEINLLEGDMRENAQKIHRYIHEPYMVGGFKELFATNSPLTQQLKTRLEKIQNGIQFIPYLYGNAGGETTFTDAKSTETKMFLKIFFQNGNRDRSRTCPLIKTVMDTDTLFRGVIIDSFTVDKDTLYTTGKPEIDKLRTFLTDTGSPNITQVNVDPVNVTGNDLIDQKAMLIVFKRKALAKYKAHLAKVIGEHRVNASAYIVAEETQKIVSELKRLWGPLFSEIDAKMESLNQQLESMNVEDVSKEDAYVPAMSILDASTAPSNVMRFITSNESTLIANPAEAERGM